MKKSSNHPVPALRGHLSLIKEGKVKIYNALTFSSSLRRSTLANVPGGGDVIIHYIQTGIFNSLVQIPPFYNLLHFLPLQAILHFRRHTV